MCRAGAYLPSRIEAPGGPQLIHPSPALAKRRLMDVAAEDDVRLVLRDPTHQLGVTKMFLPAPARRRFVRRRMIDPNPLLLRFFCVARQLSAYGLPCLRTIPPGANGNQDAVDGKTVAIGWR